MIATYFSAGAATLAAVFAGLTLYLSGRREHRRWVRDALVDTYVTYLDASFRASPRSAREARLRNGAGSPETVRARQVAETSHAVLMDTLTRLRILALPAVVSAAEDLHQADHAVLDFALGDGEVDNEERWQALRVEQNAARERLIREMRGSLDLSGSSPIRHIPTSSSWLTNYRLEVPQD